MEILQSAKQLPDDDSNVLLPEDTRLHLNKTSGIDLEGVMRRPTRSEQEPPEQYLQTTVNNRGSVVNDAAVLHDYPEVGSFEVGAVIPAQLNISTRDSKNEKTYFVTCGESS